MSIFGPLHGVPGLKLLEFRGSRRPQVTIFGLYFQRDLFLTDSRFSEPPSVSWGVSEESGSRTPAPTLVLAVGDLFRWADNPTLPLERM